MKRKLLYMLLLSCLILTQNAIYTGYTQPMRDEMYVEEAREAEGRMVAEGPYDKAVESMVWFWVVMVVVGAGIMAYVFKQKRRYKNSV